jgi:hypothetical protein
MAGPWTGGLPRLANWGKAWAYAAVLVVCAAARPGWAQTLPAPPAGSQAPSSIAPVLSQSLPFVPGPILGGQLGEDVPPPFPGPGAPQPQPLVVGPDCYASADLGVLFPHLSSLLTAPVVLGDTGTTATVALRNARLHMAPSTQVEFGAPWFGQDFGTLVFGYRLLAADGHDAFAGAGSDPVALRSRLNLQTFSIDYARNNWALDRDTTLDWEVGVQACVVFLDTEAQQPLTYQQATNYFVGAGPHVALLLDRRLSENLSIFGRFDAAVLVGYNTNQQFLYVTTDPITGERHTGMADREQSNGGPLLAVQLGVTWTPSRVPGCCLRAGYQFEQWYGLGRVQASRGDLNAHGFFFHLEHSF